MNRNHNEVHKMGPSALLSTHPFFHSKVFTGLFMVLGCWSYSVQNMNLLGDWFMGIDCILALGRAFLWNQGYDFFPPEVTCILSRVMMDLYILGTTTFTYWGIMKGAWVLAYLLYFIWCVYALHLYCSIEAEMREPLQREASEVCLANTLQYQTECVICLDELNGTIVTRLMCNHVIHKQCMDKWRQYNACCPMCMTS